MYLWVCVYIFGRKLVAKNGHILYINGKMRPVETIPGIGEWAEQIRENDGEGEFNNDIL
jgi:hypothetical protein